MQKTFSKDKMSKILITICARGGSKGVKNKNIRLINGIPLINFTIHIAKNFIEKKDALISISTDSDTIKKVAEDAGLFTNYKRPKKYSGDNSGKVETINDLLLYEEKKRKVKFDYILDLDVSSPLRSLDDLEKSFKFFKKIKDANNLFSVSEANKNPYFNMVEINDKGFSILCKKPKKEILSRQISNIVYELNASFYWYRRSFFEEKFNSVTTDNSISYNLNHICFDIDKEIDFLFMDYLISNNLLDFNFVK